MAINDEFVFTIDSDDELAVDEPVIISKTPNAKSKVLVGDDLNPDFVFDTTGDPYVDVVAAEEKDEIIVGSKPVSGVLYL